MAAPFIKTMDASTTGSKNLLFAGRKLDRYVEDMNRSGVRPIRYLTHLGIVIGEYLTPSASHVLDGHPAVEYS
jgi:hypothetical protein